MGVHGAVRRAGLALMAAGSASLSCNAFDTACSRIIRDYCTHQVDCGRSYEQLSCEDELHAELYCNPTTQPDDFDACIEDFDYLDCSGTRPESCSEILCDRDLGCQYDSCEDTTIGPNGEPICNPERTPEGGAASP